MSVALPNPPREAAKQRISSLRNGDRLTRTEFERRYRAMPHVNKAELIEGIVYVPSPVRFTQQGQPHAILIGWLIYYLSKTPGLLCGDNSTNRLDKDNKPQPLEDGLLKSRAFPGLWLDAQALMAGDLSRLFAAVDRGIKSGLHQTFAQRLRQA